MKMKTTMQIVIAVLLLAGTAICQTLPAQTPTTPEAAALRVAELNKLIPAQQATIDALQKVIDRKVKNGTLKMKVLSEERYQGRVVSQKLAPSKEDAEMQVLQEQLTTMQAEHKRLFALASK